MKNNFTRDSSLLRSLFLLFQQATQRQMPDGRIDSAEEVNNEDSNVLTGETTAVGSVYKFPMVTPGLEAMVTITGQNISDQPELLPDGHTQVGTPALQTETTLRAEPNLEEGDWVSFKIDIRNTGEVPQPPKKSNFKISLNNLF